MCGEAPAAKPQGTGPSQQKSFLLVLLLLLLLEGSPIEDE